MRLSGKRLLREMFGSKGEEETVDWRRLPNEELYDLHSSRNIIRCVIKSRRMRWAGHVARIRDRRDAYRVEVGRPNKQTTLGRSRRRWKESMDMNLQELEWGSKDWFFLAQDKDS